MPKPLIGLNADYRAVSKDAPAYTFVSADYYDAIVAVGGIPVILPPLASKEDLDSMLDILSGVLLIGGADLDPRRDGFMLHHKVRPMASRREVFDRMLIEQVAERRLPLFGIGSGMQLLNVSQGGNLFLHIPEDRPEALPHRDAMDREHRHGLEIIEDSLIGRVYGDGELRVNSLHHMSIDEVAPGFRVTARCPDGIVEVIESEMLDWFALGTQFHPESSTASALDIRIFEEFVEATRSPAAQLSAVA